MKLIALWSKLFELKLDLSFSPQLIFSGNNVLALVPPWNVHLSLCQKHKLRVANAETNNNYIEIQNGGITFRKQGDKLTISLKETFEYTDANLLKFNTTLSAGLEVIAAASKFDPPKTVSGVDI